METVSSLLILGSIVLLSVLLLKILATPIKLAFKLLINAGFGFVILFVVNFFGEFVDFTLGVNFLNALVAGVLGLPGVILLVLIKLFI